MIRNYFKTAFRNLKKNKLYSTINIVGLTLALASCLLIGLYINNELAYDSFNEQADRIVRTTMEYKMTDEVNTAATTGTKVGPEFHRTFPEVEKYVRTYISSSTVKNEGNVFTEDNILFADPAFFEIFSFDLLQGNKSAVLEAPDNIVLTQSMAKKYFGDTSPINKTLTVIGREMRVTGVCADVPQHSQIKFDFVTQFTNLGNNAQREEWWSANWITYLLLDKGTDIGRLETKMNAYMDSDAIREQTGSTGGSFLHYNLEPLLDVHLKSELAGFEPNGTMTFIYILSMIALMILLIASANYTNLATAQSSSRGGEIGIRKVMGATRKQVFSQFISETAVLTFFASALALLLAIGMIPYFNTMIGGAFERTELLQPLPIALLLLFALLVSFMAGVYPALVLSGAKTIGVLKKGFNSTGGKGFLRKSLIVGQFAISAFLIIYTLVVKQQIDFIQNKDLGYDKEHVVVLPIKGDMRQNFESLKTAFNQTPGVLSVTAAYESPEFVEWGDGVTVHTEDGIKNISLNAMPIDLDYLKTLNIALAAGRDFRKSDFAMMDTTNNRENYRQPYLINETLAKQIGWTPEEAIGQTIENRSLGPVMGVVKDFNFESLHKPIGPVLIFLEPDFSRIFMIKIAHSNRYETLSALETTFTNRTNGHPFDYHFLDEDYNALYVAEQRSSLLFNVAAGLAIILACLGLFGLAAFSTVQRKKEIGIRKTLGATLGNIVLLMSKNFLMLVGISIVLAIPLAFWAAEKWLDNFTFRVDIGPAIFIAAAVIIALIAFVTVGFHALRAAMANPVKSLRTE